MPRRQSKRDEWVWFPELSGPVLGTVTSSSLRLIRNAPGWVHRRVETLTFVDEGAVKRHLSVDFTLPGNFPPAFTLSDGQRVSYVPLTWLPRLRRGSTSDERRRRFRGHRGPVRIDVRDEHGGAMPALSWQDNSRVTGAMLGILAREVLAPHRLAGELNGVLGDALVKMPFRPYAQAIRLTRAILNPDSGEWDSFRADATARRVLAADEEFRNLLSLATGHSAVMVPLIGPPRQRRVLKLSYEEQLDSERDGILAWIRAHVGSIPWRPEVASIKFPSIGMEEAYHVQVFVPLNVEMTEARLDAWSPLDSITPDLFLQKLPKAEVTKVVEGFTTRAHLYVGDGGVRNGALRVGIRGERRGLLTWAPAASLGISLVLLAYWRWLDELVKHSSSAIAFLGLAPGIVAAYLGRPGEHALARNLLLFARLLLAVAAALVFAAAGFILAWGPSDTTTTIWPFGLKLPGDGGPVAERLRIVLGVLFGIGALNFFALLLTRWLPRRGRGE